MTYVTLVSQPGTESALSAWKHRFLTSGQPEKSQHINYLKTNNTKDGLYQKKKRA